MVNILSGMSFEGSVPSHELDRVKRQAEEHFRNFLISLGYDIDNDPNMRDTPRRVVKMYTEEICKGTYQAPPKITSFENQNLYDGIVFEGNIVLKSLCSHHMAPIRGRCHVAYIPGKKVVGLSKLNRVVDWFARRPQLQEQLTMQIHEYLKEILEDSLGIAVYIEAEHSCVVMRGVEHDSVMSTVKLSGEFLSDTSKSRDEFYQMINRLKNGF